MPPQNSQSNGLPAGYTLDSPANSGLPAGYTLDTPASPETATDRIAAPWGTTEGTVSAAPTGPRAWLGNAENDLLHGGQATFIGKALHAMGANPNGAEAGVSPATAQNMESVPLGLIHAAQGAVETPDHPIAGPLKAAGGLLQAASMPLSFLAPETEALGSSSKLSQLRQAALPTTEEAGRLFQPIEEAAKNVPVNTAPARKIAELAKDYGEAGAQGPPKVLARFLRKTEPVSGFPLPEGEETVPQVLYPQARKFAENAGRLSAGETLNSNPQMQRLVSEFAQALKDANREAAEQVGMGKEYDQAMSRYRTASQLKTLKENALKYATGVIAGGLGVEGIRRVLTTGNK
jgi:hypothetical protein